jgi:uncharacterized phiE125 gp8 family phage protein
MSNAWDEGVSWFTRRTVAPTDLPMTVEHVSDQVLNLADGGRSQRFIEGAILAATEKFERATNRALVPQTWQQVMSRFPLGANPIVLARHPLISVVSLEYVDEDGVTQSLAVSPATFITIPSGEFTPAKLTPLYGEVWPVSRIQGDAVTVTFTCGYEDNLYPEVVLTGIGLLAGELYKRRSLTTEAAVMPMPLSAFWRKVEIV